MAMRELESTRTGMIVRQLTGYSAFIPKKVNPLGPDINMDPELIMLLSEADRGLGELKGITETIPNPDLFIGFYVRKEALLSSQIEGTQCSLDEVFEVDEESSEIKPVSEVVNYINAMNQGIDELKNIPMSLRLIHQIHRTLLKDVRGKYRNPGEYKRSQNWIGAPNCTLEDAIYIPPPPQMMLGLMGDWEMYYHAVKYIPPLVAAAILHAQFETIHPYVDGNGRLGRLLITFILCEKNVLEKPLLYLSLFFKANRDKYYDLLMDIRFKGTWEEWIKFFLKGIKTTSNEAIKTANEILALQKKHTQQILKELVQYRLSLPLYELICERPIISITGARARLGASYPAVKSIFEKFIELGILDIYKKKARKSLYEYTEYLDILKRGT